MQRLNLAKNKLSLIPHDALSGLAYLETLELSDNPINQINEGDFNGKLFHSPSQFIFQFSCMKVVNLFWDGPASWARPTVLLVFFCQNVRYQICLQSQLQQESVIGFGLQQSPKSKSQSSELLLS